MSDTPVYALLGYAVASDFEFLTPMARVDAAPTMRFVVGDAPWDVPATDEDAAWRSHTVFDSGQALEAVHIIDERRTLYRFGEVADFHMEPDRITAVVLDPDYAFMVEIRLLGPVLALARELAGHPVLHASAVVLGDHAVGFLSGNGGGKTSVAATFLRRGMPLLSDDLLALDVGEAEVRGFSGYPQMRMWPEAAAHFVGSPEALEKVHPGLEKRRVPVGPGGLGVFHPDPAPISGIYELERGPEPDFDIQISDLEGADRVMTLVRHCFVGSLAHGLGLGPARLQRLALVAERIPVRRVRYTGQMADLDRVCQALDDVSRR